MVVNKVCTFYLRHVFIRYLISPILLCPYFAWGRVWWVEGGSLITKLRQSPKYCIRWLNPQLSIMERGLMPSKNNFLHILYWNPKKCWCDIMTELNHSTIHELILCRRSWGGEVAETEVVSHFYTLLLLAWLACCWDICWRKHDQWILIWHFCYFSCLSC